MGEIDQHLLTKFFNTYETYNTMSSLRHQILWIYPHVYWATYLGALDGLALLDLSPCVWGHPVKENEAKSIRGSIPMCMGPPTTHHKSQIAIWVYPHVYGATYYTSQKSNRDLGLSPCVWGNPPSIAILTCLSRSIHRC